MARGITPYRFLRQSGAPDISINFDHVGGKLVLAGEDVTSIFTTSFPPQQNAVQRPPGLRTDAGIGSLTTGVTGGDCSGERKLPTVREVYRTKVLFIVVRESKCCTTVLL